MPDAELKGPSHVRLASSEPVGLDGGDERECCWPPPGRPDEPCLSALLEASAVDAPVAVAAELMNEGKKRLSRENELDFGGCFGCVPADFLFGPAKMLPRASVDGD